MQRPTAAEAKEFRTRAASLLASGQYDELRDECRSIIDGNGPEAYLGYLWRAAAWRQSGEALGPGLYTLVENGIRLAGAEPARRADGLYMALVVYLEVAGRRFFEAKVHELLALAETEPAAVRYVSGTFQLRGWSALSRQAWQEALGFFDTAWNNLDTTPRVEVEQCMLHANRAIALLGLGRYDEAAAEAEAGLSMNYEFGCLRFELACLAAQAEMLRGRQASVPHLTHPEKEARIHYLITCGIAMACGGVSPEPDPLTEFNAVIQASSRYVYAGLADWVAGKLAAREGAR